ncbi:tetratricopeptide repeat protein [Bacteroides sp. 224]|uniref:tetratricopeptide repeat protein n=1 Tax=Bacteroides sp. 224 TaxID=2302936 RepID=UPI0013D5D41D|nr:tetratricopeptide repeat protein [Bacteroides sp. 224]NDV63677.1 hypothetical protein [Bacteroides sp. 224]
MKKTLFIAIIIYSILQIATSCSSKEFKHLSKAESIMNEYPDSALKILRAIEYPGELEGKELADYCLLITQAMDKSYVDLDSDSLINIAIKYYEHQNDEGKKALSYFYKGRYNFIKEAYTDATFYFKKAEEGALKTNNDDLAGLIYNSLGQIYYIQHLYDASITYFQKALKYALSTGNDRRVINNLLKIGKSFQISRNADSASYYIHKCIDYVSNTDSKIQGSALHNIGTFYFETGNDDEALKYLNEALKNQTNKTEKARTYTALAHLYYNRGDVKLSEDYCQKGLNTADTHLKAYIYRFLLQKAITERNIDKITPHTDSLMLYNDSIYRDKLSGKIVEIEEKYDNENLRNKQLKAELGLNRLAALLLFIILFSIAIAFIYQRNKKRQQEKLRNIIHSKETEIVLYKERLKEIEWKLEQKRQKEEEKRIIEDTLPQVNEEIPEDKDLLKERNSLIDAIKKGEDDIKKYKKSINEPINGNEQISFYESMLRGTKLCHETILKKERVRPLTTSDITDIICYYENENKEFMELLRKEEYHLSTTDIIICILLRLGHTNSRIAECLNNTSNTVATSKLRIKKNKFKIEDDRRLEEILQSL